MKYSPIEIIANYKSEYLGFTLCAILQRMEQVKINRGEVKV